jgi:hypothetical protein
MRRPVIVVAVVVAAAMWPGLVSGAGAAASLKTWGTAIEVPGTAALNTGGGALVTSVSCTSAGNCGAAGTYTDSSGESQAFVVSQVSGTWGTAIEVPGTATLNTDGDATVNSVSCSPAGTCSAGGYYDDSSGAQAFVVSRS